MDFRTSKQSTPSALRTASTAEQGFTGARRKPTNRVGNILPITLIKMKKSLNLSNLQVKSFKTQAQEIKGGHDRFDTVQPCVGPNNQATGAVWGCD